MIETILVLMVVGFILVAGSDKASLSFWKKGDDPFNNQLRFDDTYEMDNYDHDWLNSPSGIDKDLFDHNLGVRHGSMLDDYFEDHTGCMDDNAVNPVNGLPMIGGICGIDVAGNPYGMDMNDSWSDPFEPTTWDDHATGISPFDDDFGSGGGSDDW